MVPGDVITSVAQVTAEWLTAVLTHSGALTHGHVTEVKLDTGGGNWSANAKLSIAYAPESRGTLPKNLFLKMVNADTGDGEFFSESEVTYYTRDYVDVDHAPLIHCYDAAYSDRLKRYHLLLDDVSSTHIEAIQKEPTLEYGLALAEGLATLHARWWGAQRLIEAGAPIHDATHIQQFADIAAPGVGHILADCAGDLAPHWPQLMHELFARHPQALIARTRNPSGFTLIHGDVGPYNVLVPHEGTRPLYIIDRQPFDWSLTTWLGVYDLAYAMVLDWEPDARKRFEIPVLEQYHAQLRENGVRDYAWQQLYDDYRLCAAMGVYIATEYCRGRLNEQWRHVWLPMLQHALTACDDLDCRALWQGFAPAT